MRAAGLSTRWPAYPPDPCLSTCCGTLGPDGGRDGRLEARSDYAIQLQSSHTIAIPFAFTHALGLLSRRNYHSDETIVKCYYKTHTSFFDRNQLVDLSQVEWEIMILQQSKWETMNKCSTAHRLNLRPPAGGSPINHHAAPERNRSVDLKVGLCTGGWVSALPTSL